jgi:hypothetical protein
MLFVIWLILQTLYYDTEQVDSIGKPFWLVSGKHSARISTGTPSILIEDFRGFLSPSSQIPGTLP